MEKLSYSLLERRGYEGYLLKDAPERVLQFGEGAFLRAFAEDFIDQMNEKAGLPIQVVDDHVPYKQRKVRILNGAHTGFVLAAHLAGFKIVRDCMEDDVVRSFMNRLLYGEVMPSLLDSAANTGKLPPLPHFLLRRLYRLLPGLPRPGRPLGAGVLSGVQGGLSRRTGPRRRPQRADVGQGTGRSEGLRGGGDRRPGTHRPHGRL